MLTTSLALIIKQDYNNDGFALNKLSISTINVLIFPTRVAVAVAILNLLYHLLLSIVLFSALHVRSILFCAVCRNLLVRFSTHASSESESNYNRNF